MTDLGRVREYLGVEFHRTPHGLLVHQTLFVHEILQEFAYSKYRPVTFP